VKFNGVIFPIEVPRITMPFRATETKWYSDEKPHRGVDLAPWPGSTGRPVRMPLHGEVVHIGENTYAGLEIVTRHEVPYDFWAANLKHQTRMIAAGAPFFLRSTHHSSIKVAQGAKVPAGTVIALIGNTGLYSTGPHVHLELHAGSYPSEHLDPMHFFIAAIPGLRASLIQPW
jgi:murein DD-endopeptidase MepM/ murein hydrolase activator NlpD